MIHLDTSFLIRGFVRGSAEDRALRRWLKSGEALGMSAIAWTELTNIADFRRFAAHGLALLEA